jgi:hypothetical protein
MLSDANIREQLGSLLDPGPDPTPKPRSRVPLIAILVVLCLWGASLALLIHFDRTAPRIPDPPTGHVYRFNDQHRVVYLTAKQNYSAYTALAIPILATIAVALYATRKEPPPNESF